MVLTSLSVRFSSHRSRAWPLCGWNILYRPCSGTASASKGYCTSVGSCVACSLVCRVLGHCAAWPRSLRNFRSTDTSRNGRASSNSGASFAMPVHGADTAPGQISNPAKRARFQIRPLSASNLNVRPAPASGRAFSPAYRFAYFAFAYRLTRTSIR